MTSAEDIIRFKHLRKRFGAVDALRDVSFEVNEREIVALLGDNGAGKSTVVKCIAGLHQPDSGEIEIGGTPVTIRTPGEARTLGISVVFQDLAMFDNLSVAENFFAGVELRLPAWLGAAARLRKKEMLTQARETLERLEVHVPDLNVPVGLLSGGQRQAIAVAKGVAFGRRFVVLDEPTAALGVRERENVLRLVSRLPDQGISVLLVSHNMEEVMTVADRAVILRQGIKVGECAAVEENHERIISLIVGPATTHMRIGTSAAESHALN